MSDHPNIGSSYRNPQPYSKVLKEYTPFQGLVAEAIKEGVIQSRGNFFSRFLNFSWEQLVTLLVVGGGGYLLPHAFSIKEESSLSFQQTQAVPSKEIVVQDQKHQTTNVE